MAIVRHLMSSAPSVWGIEYNDANGRVSSVFNDGPMTLVADVELTDGRAFHQTLAAGQSIAIPGGAISVVTNAEGGIEEFAGLRRLSFSWVT